MAYLIQHDYKKLIQTDNLSQVIGADNSVLSQMEAVAQAEIVGHLIQKYEVSKEFTSTSQYTTYGGTYSAKNRIYLDGNTYNAALTYTAHSIVLYSGSVYFNANAINTPEAWNSSHWTLLGLQYDMFYVSLPDPEYDFYTVYVVGDKVWYKNKKYTALMGSSNLTPDLNPTIWGQGTTYTVTALPTDTTKWTAGDNRNPLMVATMIDVTLYHVHSRISPRNIPELRVKRYDDAKEWLRNCARGEMTADIPKIQPTQGMRIRMGSRLEKQNNNF